VGGFAVLSLAGLIKSFLKSVDWGELDYLVGDVM
jgi:hypothetical protein